MAKEEDFMTLIDCYVVCKFTRGIYKGVPEQAEVYEMVTGIPTTEEHLIRRAKAITTLGKLFNIREALLEGIKPMDEDKLPKRCYDEPNLDGPTKGWAIDREGHKTVLIQYYLAKGWDERGYPRKSTMKEYGITDYEEQIKGVEWVD